MRIIGRHAGAGHVGLKKFLPLPSHPICNKVCFLPKHLSNKWLIHKDTIQGSWNFVHVQITEIKTTKWLPSLNSLSPLSFLTFLSPSLFNFFYLKTKNKKPLSKRLKEIKGRDTMSRSMSKGNRIFLPLVDTLGDWLRKRVLNCAILDEVATRAWVPLLLEWFWKDSGRDCLFECKIVEPLYIT